MNKTAKSLVRFVSFLLLTATFLPLVSCAWNNPSGGDKDDFDLNGFTLSVLSVTPWDNSVPADLMSIEEAQGDTIKETVLSRNSKVQKQYGLEVKQTYLSDEANILEEVVKFTAAQDDAYKCVTAQASLCTPYIQQGIFNNVNSLPNIEFNADYWDGKTMDALSINGFNVSLVGDILFSDCEGMSVLMYNTPLANDYGMENLYDVTKNGNWTFDRMATEMEKVVTDLNNDGQYDIRDRIGLLYTTDNVTPAFYSSDITFIEKDSAGEYVFTGVGNERAQLVTEKVQKLIHNKGYAMNWLVFETRNTIIEMIENKQVLFQWTVISAIRRYFRDIKTDFGILPIPKLSEDQEHYATSKSGGSLEIPTSNLELDKTGAALEALARESLDFPNVYFHVCLESKYTRDEESIDMIMMAYENAYIDPLYFYHIGNLDSVLNAVITSKRNYNSSVDSYVDAVEEDIVNLMTMDIK